MSAPAPSQLLGPYRLIERIGRGGMGEVWKARDTRLDREVAVKLSAEQFSDRFDKEARAIAALNHPNICTLFDVGPNYLVMELIDGPTLADRIAEGPIPLEESLAIVKQIADALEAAHEKNIVHRDLKPGNIKIRPDGSVKVLDFGLAKASGPETVVTGDSPTMLHTPTQMGVILGTAAYMAPEQARGKNVDKRADIWSFGVVLHEMLTGKRTFEGEDLTETLASVVKSDPDLTPVPHKVRRLVAKCLQKDPKKRLRDIGDAWDYLDTPAELVTAPSQSRLGIVWPVVAGILALTAIVIGTLLWRATRPVEHPLTRLGLDLGANTVAGINLTVAISPDGRRLVFPVRGPDGRQQLATRLLDQAEATLLPGTEMGASPFFSPDGQWVGFFGLGTLKKISVQGGAAVTLTNTNNPTDFGASWGDDGNIVLNGGTLLTLFRIPGAGGKTQPLTRVARGEITHRWPQVLPGAKAVLFTASPSAVSFENASIEAVSLKTGQVKVLQRGGYFGRYLPSGHLLYVHQGVLFGVAFDPDRLELHGAPVPLVDDVAANSVTGGGQFDFSNNGTFVYAAGKGSAQKWQISWLDGAGRLQPLLSPGGYTGLHVSPDGKKLVFQESGDISVHDWARDTTSRLTFTGHANIPVWTPDGKHVVFQSVESGTSIEWIRSDGAGSVQRLLQSADSLAPWSFTPDGKRLAYFENHPDTGYDIGVLPLDLTDPEHPKPGKPEVFLQTPASELVPQISTDGRWLAYRSNESGNGEIYVRPFPDSSRGKWQISSGGGLYAFWAPNGHELFYEAADNRIMVVDYSASGGSFAAGKPRVWSDRQLFYTGVTNLDMAPDGKRFAVFILPEESAGEKNSLHVNMLENFFDDVKRKIPVK